MAAPAYAAIRVAAVPEHFTSPLYQLEAKSKDGEHGVRFNIVNCPGGSGEMIGLMNDGKVDVIVALTEALLASSLKDDASTVPYRLIGTYVQSPLTWAIATNPAREAFSSFPRENGNWDVLRGCRVGISRVGSGSHIIPFVMRKMRGWNEHFTFVTLNNIDELVAGLAEADACDAFLWEQTMTKKYFDSEKLHHLSNVIPPWCAFSIAASTEIIKSRPSDLVKLLEEISNATAIFMTDQASAVEYIADRFHQDAKDVQKWLTTVSYPKDARLVDSAVINSCSDILKDAGLVERGGEDVRVEEVVEARIATIIPAL
ncbi:hypothetical protein SeLEV6574_g00751 [Synchytrium endobioticum]|uniref:Ca3427-like PBP 2 domain-containing protein n=1 Tax=Synchytrium endobioticum TaxID=286115 RepID=A0A507DG67_9FUNG|nr:hypothetical protein SeLEV6574_g00751 [Synchytrium endobioticum]